MNQNEHNDYQEHQQFKNDEPVQEKERFNEHFHIKEKEFIPEKEEDNKKNESHKNKKIPQRFIATFFAITVGVTILPNITNIDRQVYLDDLIIGADFIDYTITIEEEIDRNIFKVILFNDYSKQERIIEKGTNMGSFYELKPDMDIISKLNHKKTIKLYLLSILEQLLNQLCD